MFKSLQDGDSFGLAEIQNLCKQQIHVTQMVEIVLRLVENMDKD